VEKQVHEVDLGGFLCGGGMLFEDTAHGDGLTEHVAGSLGHVVPVAVGLAVLSASTTQTVFLSHTDLTDSTDSAFGTGCA